MSIEQVRHKISENLRASNTEPGLVRIDEDSAGGVRIIIVSASFEGKLPNERREIVLKDLGSLKIEWLELLTPEEREWAGELPNDTPNDQLPLWPQALARMPENFPLFPSQLDDDLELPITATFYSLRGGVGRSTALAYTALILSSQGRKVVCVDMDLEAPGLPALFGKEDDVKPNLGLVSLLLTIDSGGAPDVTEHLIRIKQSEDIYCLPAGKPDAEYSRKLGLMDPASWYREEKNPLRELLRLLKEGLPFRPDVILLDSRTGISPISAPLLFDLADIAMVAFFPHPQALTGTGALVRALLAAKTGRSMPHQLTPEPRFIVTPIPSVRIPEVVQRYQHRAIEWISEWITSSRNIGQSELAINESEITHFIPYKESIASSDRVSSDEEVWRDYLPLADWIDRFLPSKVDPILMPSVSSSKGAVLSELRFTGGTAEDQTDLLSTFVETELVKRALGSTPLILGRKGTGKTAIFRRMAEDSAFASIVVTGHSNRRHNLLSSDGFQSMEGFLADNRLEWRQFWLIYIDYVIYSSASFAREDNPEFRLALPNLRPTSELEMVDAIKQALSIPDASLLGRDFLRRLDALAPAPVRLLFDGLDTGFGSSDSDRRRRKAALEGLFSLYLGVSESLKKFCFKILLREDIWRQLQFENKSHLFGKTETLRWNDQASLFRVAIKQALRSPAYSNLVNVLFSQSRREIGGIEFWSDADVLSVWNLLVGERMKGGRATFTRNWVWNRLADANGDHSPRYLIQLLNKAVEWERAENSKSPYEKSIIRPRALIEVFPEVSAQAVSAMRDEEFQELAPLMTRLTEVGRTPLDKHDLEEIDSSSLQLARDVGLLGIYEGSEEAIDRFRVPELFRYALGMTRKGQA